MGEQARLIQAQLVHERSGSSWRGSEYIILENGDIDDSLRNMLRKKFCDDFAWDAYEAVGTVSREHEQYLRFSAPPSSVA